MKIKHFEVSVEIVEEDGTIHNGTFGRMSDAGKFAEDTTNEIYNK